MSDATTNLMLPYLAAAQAQKHVTVNDTLRALDAIVQLGVLDRDLTAPPGSPADSDRYIVAAGATGAWAGKDGQITAYQDGAWAFYQPKTGWRAWVADESALLAYNGSSWVATSSGGGGGGGGLTLGTVVATTSGTAIDFTSIPAGVERISVLLDGVSVSGSSNIIVQIGDSGGIEASAYYGSSARVTTTVASTSYSNGFLIRTSAAAVVIRGILTLMKQSGNVWVASGSFGRSDSAGMIITGGRKALSAELDRLRLTTVGGTDTFDNGSVNISWE